MKSIYFKFKICLLICLAIQMKMVFAMNPIELESLELATDNLELNEIIEKIANFDNDEAVKLLERHIESNLQDEVGNTVLHHAVFRNNLDIIRYLISKNWNINAVNEHYQNPLFVAIAKGHNDALELLLNAKTSQLNDSLVHTACQFNNLTALQILKKFGFDFNYIVSNELTPLHTALLHSADIRLIEFLIKNGANSSLLFKGYTPQYIASQSIYYPNEDERLYLMKILSE